MKEETKEEKKREAKKTDKAKKKEQKQEDQEETKTSTRTAGKQLPDYKDIKLVSDRAGIKEVKGNKRRGKPVTNLDQVITFH